MRIALLFVPGLAFAQTLHTEAAGSSLSIDGPCAVDVRLTVDPALTGKVVLDATAAREEEISGLALRTEQQKAVLQHEGECPDGQETLHLAIRIPPRFPLSIDDSGGGHYGVPDLHAPVSIDSSGSLTIEMGAVGPFSLEQSGSGTVNVVAVEGAVHVEQSGSGEVAIGGGRIPALELTASGSGRFHYGPGSIGALQLESSGNADIGIEAEVGAASFDVSGSGTVRVRRVTGPVSRNEEGSARLIIENR